jgi:hypothetical protein
MHYRIKITPDTERDYGINTGRRIICGRIRNRTQRENHTSER